MTASPSKSDIKEWLPWLHLLRAVSLALHGRLLVLGALGVVLTAFGWGAASHYLPFSPRPEQSVLIPAAFESEQRELLPSDPVLRMNWFDPLRLIPWLTDAESVGDAFFPAATAEYAREIDDFTPLHSVWKPARRLIKTGNSIESIAWSVTQLLWALIVWSWIGGAIARLAAMQFATFERRSIWQGLRFSGQQMLSYLCALLLPLSAIVFMAGGIALTGWICSCIPSPGGSLLMGLLSGVCLILGFLMTMMLLGVALGWPLMVAAISTEDSDGFDGLSRAFGFLYDRPWHALGMGVISLALSVVGAAFLRVLLTAVIYVTGASIAAGFGVEDTHRLGFYLIPDDTQSHMSLAWIWLIIPWLLMMGFGSSYIWVSSTVIYFLLRQSDDGTPLNVVADFRAKA